MQIDNIQTIRVPRALADNAHFIISIRNAITGRHGQICLASPQIQFAHGRQGLKNSFESPLLHLRTMAIHTGHSDGQECHKISHTGLFDWVSRNGVVKILSAFLKNETMGAKCEINRLAIMLLLT